MLISIIFSFYNEQESLTELIARLRAVFAALPCDYELIFVNDASSDQSVAVLTKLARSSPKREKIVCVTMSRRWGVEECFMAGLEQSKGDAAILMYTDLQEPPELIPQMMDAWQKGADIVHTIRRRRINENVLKRLAAFIAYRFIAFFSDTTIPLDAGEFKLMSRRVVGYLLRCPEPNPYLRGLIPWIGFKQSQVYYDLGERRFGSSKIALFGSKAWSVFFSGIFAFSALPVIGIFVMGFLGVCVLLGLAMSTSSQINAQHAIFVIVVLWAMLMIAIGIVGVYALKIFRTVSGRPRYIVDEIKVLTDA